MDQLYDEDRPEYIAFACEDNSWDESYGSFHADGTSTGCTDDQQQGTYLSQLKK